MLSFSDITQFFDRDKSYAILHLTKGKSKDLKRLLKYFNGTETSVSNMVLLIGVLPIIFVLHSKDLLVVVFFHYYSTIIFILFYSHCSSLHLYNNS